MPPVPPAPGSYAYEDWYFFMIQTFYMYFLPVAMERYLVVRGYMLAHVPTIRTELATWLPFLCEVAVPSSSHPSAPNEALCRLKCTLYNG